MLTGGIGLTREEIRELAAIGHDSVLGFDLAVLSGRINSDVIRSLWKEKKAVGQDIVLRLNGDMDRRARSKLISYLMEIVESEHDSLSLEDARIRAEVAMMLVEVADKDRIPRAQWGGNNWREKPVLRDKESSIYLALVSAPSLNDASGGYIAKMSKFIQNRTIAPPSLSMIKKLLLTDKVIRKKETQICLFLILAFGTDESEVKQIGDIIRSKGIGLMLFSISDLINSGITTEKSLSTGPYVGNGNIYFYDPLKRRMTFLDDDILDYIEGSFREHARSRVELDLITVLFADIMEAKKNRSQTEVIS